MRITTVILYFLCFGLISIAANAQSPYNYKALTTTLNEKCGGYYEFLPYNYYDNTETYPLLLDLHGMGGQGSGSVNDLNKLLRFNTPYFIVNNQFPESFSVKGITYRFVVIAPQFSTTGTGKDVKDVLDYITTHYRIDPERIYVTGYSRGGEPTWRFPCTELENAQRIAALVPVAGVNSDPDHTGVQNIAAAHLPVWALHSLDDKGSSTRAENSINFINAINDLEPAVPAVFTALQGTHNETWYNVYDPSAKFSIEGEEYNIYEWMLTQKRTTAALPVTLSYFKASSVDDHSVLLQWSSSYEMNNEAYIIERSADQIHFTAFSTLPATNIVTGSSYALTDPAPLQGVNFYRLTQMDKDGKKTMLQIARVHVGTRQTAIKAFPNPLTGATLTIQVPGALKQYTINIYDVTGKVLFSNQIRPLSRQVQITQEHLITGTNLVEVRGDNLRAVIRITKH